MSPNRATRRAEDRAGDSPAAAADSPAPAVEEREIDLRASGRLDEAGLSLLERPAGRADPRVLVAVGVSDHHHLLHASFGEVCPVEGLAEQLTHDRGRRGEIGHGLEEWCDVQRHVTFARLTEPAPPGEHENREDVVRALRHADDVGTHGVRPKACATLGDCCEHLQRAGGLGVRRSRGLLSLREQSLQPREAVGRWARVPLRVRKQRCERNAGPLAAADQTVATLDVGAGPGGPFARAVATTLQHQRASDRRQPLDLRHGQRERSIDHAVNDQSMLRRIDRLDARMVPFAVQRRGRDRSHGRLKRSEAGTRLRRLRVPVPADRLLERRALTVRSQRSAKIPWRVPREQLLALG